MALPTAKYKDLQNLLQKEETNSQLDMYKVSYTSNEIELNKNLL
jgi:hypothetical protein